MTSITSLAFNQHETMTCLCSNKYNQPSSYNTPYCAQDPFCCDCLQAETQADHHYTESSTRQEALQLFMPSLGNYSICFGQKQGINCLLQKNESRQFVSERIEELVNEMSAFVYLFLRMKVNGILAKDYEKTQGGDYLNEKQMSESNTINFISNIDKAKDDALNSQLFALNQIKLMRERFQSSSHRLSSLLDNAFESFFNKETSVEPSFEKEINDIMNDTASLCTLKTHHPVKENTTSNQSTSNPSNSMKANHENDNEMNHPQDPPHHSNTKMTMNQSQLSSQLRKEEVDDFFLSSIINNNNNNNVYSFDSSLNSSISLTPKCEKADSSNGTEEEEDSSTKETRYQIEELISRRTSNKSNEYNHQLSNDTKVSRKCTTCQKAFFSRPDQTWRTRCYYCQQEFKRTCNELSHQINAETGSKDIIYNSSNKSNKSRRIKQVCVDCKKIFVVQSALAKKRKRCYTCYKEIN